MMPNDISNTLLEAQALLWVDSNKVERVNIDSALAWLEAQEKEQGE